MKSSEASDQKNTATDRTSGEAVITLPHDAAHRLAYVLKAIEDEEMRFAEARTEHKDTMERLHNLAYKIRCEILTGQMGLLDAMQATADLVNSGALNTKDVKVTAKVSA